MAPVAELFTTDHTRALYHADRLEDPSLEVAERALLPSTVVAMVGVGDLELETLVELVAEYIGANPIQVAADLVDVERDRLLVLPTEAVEVLAELSGLDRDRVDHLAALWAHSADVSFPSASAEPLVRAIGALATTALKLGQELYLWCSE